MEARECAQSPVVVVGGGNSAGQAAVFLADSGSPVTVVIRGPDLNASMSRYLVDRIEGHDRIELRANTKVIDLDGDETLRSVRLSGVDGDTTVSCAALFSFIGADPSSDWLSGCAALDERGFVLTDRSLGDEHLDSRWALLGRRPLPFETSHPGLFAVGDIRSWVHQTSRHGCRRRVGRGALGSRVPRVRTLIGEGHGTGRPTIPRPLSTRCSARSSTSSRT